MTRRLLATGALAALLLTGCSGDDDGPPEPTEAPPSAVDQSRVAPSSLPSAPEVEEPTGAARDVVLDECPTEAGTQEVVGTLTSSATDETDYVITVNWVNDTSDVRGRAVVVVEDVEPGSEQEFSAEAEVAEGATACTRNVVHGTVEKE